MRYIKVEGIIESGNLSPDDLMDKFLEFLEANKSFFGGRFTEVDEIGDPIK